MLTPRPFESPRAPLEIRPVAFGPGARPLFGFLHGGFLDGHVSSPDGGEGPEAQAPALAVVFCNPFGLEAMCLHRTYLHLADRFAAAGICALRFDYDGTGDSAGRSDDPSRVRAWIDSVHFAIAEVRARLPGRRVALFGARLGAALAAVAAMEDRDVECLIAWAPVVSGAAYVRELRAFRAMMDPKSRPRANGAEEALGYPLTEETLAQLAALDLLSGPSALRAAARALVIPGDAPEDAARLVRLWQTSGAEVTVGPRTRYARMLGDPYDTAVPEATLEAVVAWVREKDYSAGEGRERIGPAGASLSVRATESGPPLHETPFLFGEGERLFGVLTELAETEPPRRFDRPAVFFLNVGANHHVGPQRMWVTLAREVASLGYRAFRFDVSGLGDSRAPEGGRENLIYSPDFVADVQCAMTLLGRVCSAQRFVLVGLCSGAYLAFHAAVADSRVAGQVLLNTHVFEWKEGDPVKPTPSQHYYLRSLSDHRVWLRALRGKVNIRYVAGVLLKALQPEIAGAMRLFARHVPGRDAAGAVVKNGFEAMCRRGVQSLLVFGSFDGGLDMLAKYLGRRARSMRRYPNFSLEVVDGVDHVFARAEDQATLKRILIRYLTKHFP